MRRQEAIYQHRQFECAVATLKREVAALTAEISKNDDACAKPDNVRFNASVPTFAYCATPTPNHSRISTAPQVTSAHATTRRAVSFSFMNSQPISTAKIELSSRSAETIAMGRKR